MPTKYTVKNERGKREKYTPLGDREYQPYSKIVDVTILTISLLYLF